jgi:hypothetical protein
MVMVLRKRQLPALFCGFLLSMLCGTENLPAGEPAQGVAVLQDGRTIQGKIQEVAGGYRVDHAGGHFILPYTEVSLTSASLVGAYQAYRDSIQKPSAESHLALAEWCISNNLLAQARDEIEAALRLEPQRAEARALLKQVDVLIHGYAGTPAPSNPPAEAIRPTAAIPLAQFDRSQERTSAGLSRETHQEFVARVQPLLINKCANAKCHGPAGSTQFTLIGTRIGSSNHRLASERNLEMLFSWIDAAAPRQSPLLTKPGEPSDAHREIFLGERQHQQYLILENWVASVIREKGNDLGAAVRHANPSPATDLHTGHSSLQLAGGAPQDPATLSPAARSVPAETNEFLDRVRKQSRPDAFDPNLFNRQFHSPAAMSIDSTSIPSRTP